jgi:site-specific DNA-methyltransferase (adenine-specific)
VIAALQNVSDGQIDLRQQECLTLLGSLPDESVDVVVTDPAYSGMNQHLKLGHGRIVGDYRGGAGGGLDGKWFAEFHDDPQTFGTFLAECRRVLKPNRHLYLMFDSYSLLSLGPHVREHFALKNVIVWDKTLLGMGHYFRRRHELVLFACKGRRKLSRRDLPDVWRIRRLLRAPYPTQKPVELFQAMLCASTEPGFLVCDPFMGSGSSAIAALRHGCRFVGGDSAERAVDMARRRVDEFLARGVDPLQPQPALGRGDRAFWLAPQESQRRLPIDQATREASAHDAPA